MEKCLICEGASQEKHLTSWMPYSKEVKCFSCASYLSDSELFNGYFYEGEWLLKPKMDTKRLEVPKDLYVSWLNDELTTLEGKTLEDIESRIVELEKMQFEVKARAGVAHKKRVELMGSNFKANRDSLVTDHNFSVNFEEKKAKPKAEKKAREKSDPTDLLAALGIDIDSLKKDLKEMKK